MQKKTLSDAKQRRQAEREKRKLQLKADVQNLESEVAQLHQKYNIPGLHTPKNFLIFFRYFVVKLYENGRKQKTLEPKK